jgi:hypothetical protein
MSAAPKSTTPREANDCCAQIICGETKVAGPFASSDKRRHSEDVVL